PTHTNTTSVYGDIRRVSDAYLVGVLFFIGTLSLAVSTYGEVLVARYLGTYDDISIYYRATVVYLFPGIVLNQYLMATVGPFLRQNERYCNGLIKRYVAYCAVAMVLVVLPCIFLVGLLLERVIYGNSDISV